MSENDNREPEGQPEASSSPVASEPTVEPAQVESAQTETAQQEKAQTETAQPEPATTDTQPAAAVPSEPEAPAAQTEAPATQAEAPAAQEEAAAPPPARRVETDEEKAARRKAALEAREAAKAAAAQAAAQAAQAGTDGRAAAKAGDGESSEGEEAPPKPPSPKQPLLDKVTRLLRELVAEDAVEEAYINEANDHLPTLVVKNERWLQAASLFRNHTDLQCSYLRNVSGVDYETYMEVVYYPLNMDSRECYCVKVRADRELPSVGSVTPIWETANWNEREIYDLLGIDFPGHPDLKRIMMPDDWVGHPLRKDYVPLDPEV
ncbi:NADH-quinone oxidoreductase subunit C [Cohnella endophytica]|uniref:NADH-quinone oxidoreductase n=1 Tax=Cohnella endophytica TaxID=2419778 RepID=A0A494XGM1_9BACL|nr:NADH-quinone oxidoreductase subunit C [Cohnella endophytica]RKP47299.1 NADH-quinone oxidoreductase subunit C [Cohnella endophytica]